MNDKHVVNNNKIWNRVAWQFLDYLFLFFIENRKKLQKALFCKEKNEITFFIDFNQVDIMCFVFLFSENLLIIFSPVKSQ